MDPEETVFSAGPIRLTLAYRAELPGDQGLCIRVWEGQAGGDEILRFDCFDQAPHYHYGPARDNVRLPLDTTSEGNPVAWTLRQIRTQLPAMVRRAGYDAVSDALEAAPVAEDMLDTIEQTAWELSRSGRRTVVHNRGDEIFEAGNIRFGLEYRELGGDGGLAIHVLGEALGQEIELLAFDCFEQSPHYHYGPRQQDVRIFWDTTTTRDTLRWTLDRFREGRLGAMIDRAGYPTIANGVDETLIQAVLPRMEERAFAIVGEHASDGGK